MTQKRKKAPGATIKAALIGLGGVFITIFFQFYFTRMEIDASLGKDASGNIQGYTTVDNSLGKLVSLKFFANNLVAEDETSCVYQVHFSNFDVAPDAVDNINVRFLYDGNVFVMNGRRQSFFTDHDIFISSFPQLFRVPPEVKIYSDYHAGAYQMLPILLEKEVIKDFYIGVYLHFDTKSIREIGHLPIGYYPWGWYERLGEIYNGFTELEVSFELELVSGDIIETEAVPCTFILK